MFKLHLVIGVIVLLFAGVALVVKVGDGKEDVEPEVEVVTVSSFEGVDGSLTIFAFDLVANAYKTYLDETEESEVLEFDVWLFGNADRLPQTDAFKRAIQLRKQDDPSVFVLFSAGRDDVVNTEDDYIKTYEQL
ncbi:hypothetical protein HQ524_02680 [Candidatus Uhrbacteria bacterium]|nr:hypothetical protein [Candidatus Uhrbacteria bacterium]